VDTEPRTQMNLVNKKGKWYCSNVALKDDLQGEGSSTKLSKAIFQLELVIFST